jgi:hypothetical protein
VGCPEFSFAEFENEIRIWIPLSEELLIGWIALVCTIRFLLCEFFQILAILIGIFFRCRYFDETEDEYAGLMSQRDKQFIINIQLSQLKCDNPFIDDYYYTMFTAK